jgi:hypothetical protein
VCVAITGAGDSELIETVSPLIENALFGDYSPKQIRFDDEYRFIIEKTMLQFFDTSIRPWARFPRDDRPAMPDLLIAIGVSNDVEQGDFLFRASPTTVRQIHPGAECIGIGSLVAKSLIERLYSPFSDLDDLILAACYMMYHAKRWTDGCGGNTDMIVSSVKNDRFGGVFNTSQIRKSEEAFDEFDEHMRLLLSPFANANVNNSDFRKKIRDIQERLIEIRKKSPLASIAETLKEFRPKKPLPASGPPSEPPVQS